tara:strand:+ start:8916 stop:9488 length:573 start_codon:yes stop_codon:yes gene_type:complete
MDKNILNNDNLLYTSLIEFYNEDKNIEKLYEILNSTKISLRIIDWFVTNFSKKFNTHYSLYVTPNNKITMNSINNKLFKQITVHHSYKSQLKSYQKKNFDPFCRRSRILFQCKNYEISTTIGQLNFFKWAIENLLLDYIKNNHSEIEEDMNLSINRKKKSKDSLKKRQELSKSASRGLNKNNMKVIISFD